MPLGQHYRVEGLVRLSEGRMFYLVDDDRPDVRTRRCGHCRSELTPREATACVTCGYPLGERQRYLMSVRWDRRYYEAYSRFYEKQFEHPAILRPDDVLMHDGLLCSLVRYQDEGLLIDQVAPLHARELLELAMRLAGVVAWLHRQGISMHRVDRANLLVRRNARHPLLFDPDVQEVFPGEVPGEFRTQEIRSIGRMLRYLTPVDRPDLLQFFLDAEDGGFASPEAFGREAERLAEQLEPTPLPRGIAAMSDVGLARILNEDSWGWTQLDERTRLYVVADGMGGHDSGEVASDVAVRTILQGAQERFEALPAPTPEALENLLDEAFQAANNQVKAVAEERQNDMGTTLVALLIRDHLALLANVGDSRAYLLRDERLHQITQDHSLVAKMVEQRRITAEEARTHPYANVLLRTVGTERDVDIDIFQLELEPGDRLLLCSDGLWGEVEGEEMERILNTWRDARACAWELIQAAHRGGGKDNITVLIVTVPRSGGR